jgi:hypothetical protein
MESSIGINYFIAEEGGRIKKIIISKEGFLK